MVREHIDTIDSLMARYVAGSLPTPARILVESHLQLKADNRGYVHELEALAGDVLSQFEPAAISSADRKRMLDAVYSAPAPEAPAASGFARESGSVFPRPLRNFVGFDADKVPWRTKLPGFREYDVGELEGCHVTLFWIKPGRTIPAHTHQGCEISLVLDGDFSDASGCYGRGDISVADDTVDHRPIAGKDRPCIGFAVTDAPLKFTGPLGQFLRDLVG